MILSRFRRSTTPAGIPKLIHVIWIGTKPFPYEKNLRTWKQHNPDYRVRLWTDTNLPVLHNNWLYKTLACQRLPIAARADLLRLELLHQFGGIYTDADSWCTKPLAPLVDDLPLFGMTGNRGNVQNATLGAPPRHPAYTAAVHAATGRYMRLASLKRNHDPGYEIFDLFGTRYITPILRTFPDFVQVDHGAQRGTRRLICVQGQDDTTSAYIVHANDTSWKTKGTDNRFTLVSACPAD